MIFTDTETPLVASVINRLTLAGWLEGHNFIVAVGYKLRWSELGAARGFLLKQVIKDHALSESEETVLRFNRRCVERSSTISNEELPPADIDFWLTCMKELNPEDQKDFMWPLVKVLSIWQPQMQLNRA